ncbi:hypothetical protein [Streptomyces radicis]|uniref:Uncharacterized protein n=1 Tax=Streptomyces radicis TaxID=1750517 RepID=A0A3A9WJP3_9ACTN|nr:hypothetical protein [Streptomyces radicis]RKN09664.1 hypothetical protein D7319_11420 [Streptomyces radicis]RKN23302.1 hypothetical protein D7318_12375 [Streptomyces radicis]
MHIHGYEWLGEKATFDREGTRRPVEREPTPQSPQDVIERYRRAAAEFPTSEVPPLETALWLMKPTAVIRGTWTEPKEAGEWLDLRLAELAPRYASAGDRDATRLTARVKAAVERLARGGDVSLGHYVKGTVFHSVALVTCSPNHTRPTLPCPAR